MTKEKYVVAGDKGDLNAEPIDWSVLPENFIDSLPGKYLYNVLACDTEGELVEKTVVYIKKVSKFPRGTVKYDLSDIVIGI